MEFAVIQTGGKQYKVKVGDEIKIEKILGDHKEGDKVVWMAPKTRSMYATFVSTEVKADGKEWSIIHVAGTGRILVMASDLTPAW